MCEALDSGMYVIEDIETSYWDQPGASLYGYTMHNAGIGQRGNAVERLKVRRCKLNGLES